MAKMPTLIVRQPLLVEVAEVLEEDAEVEVEEVLLTLDYHKLVVLLELDEEEELPRPKLPKSRHRRWLAAGLS